LISKTFGRDNRDSNTDIYTVITYYNKGKNETNVILIVFVYADTTQTVL
jgi:hypothetical protein